MSNITLGVTEAVTPSADGQVGAPEGRRVRGRYPNARLAEAATLMRRVWEGDYRAMLQLREALSTSDFGALFGATLDRQLLATYQATTPVWQSFATRRVVKDFRPSTFFDVLGGQAILPKVGQLGEYPQRGVDISDYTLQVAKRGARFSLSWETLVNDDLDAFRDLPQRLAQAARNTEDFVATGLLEVDGAPNPAFFTGGTVLTGNPALTSDSLEDAIQAVKSRKDSDGNPVATGGLVLVVPSALEMTARRILDTTEVRITDGTRTLVTGNSLSNQVQLSVNPWLTSATAWYVVPVPNQGRPALAVGFLRGYETPEIRVKADGGQMLGGGQVPPEDGSFDIDDIQYRARHVIGGSTLVGDAAIASNGTGA